MKSSVACANAIAFYKNSPPLINNKAVVIRRCLDRIDFSCAKPVVIARKVVVCELISGMFDSSVDRAVDKILIDGKQFGTVNRVLIKSPHVACIEFSEVNEAYSYFTSGPKEFRKSFGESTLEGYSCQYSRASTASIHTSNIAPVDSLNKERELVEWERSLLKKERSLNEREFSLRNAESAFNARVREFEIQQERARFVPPPTAVERPMAIPSQSSHSYPHPSPHQPPQQPPSYGREREQRERNYPEFDRPSSSSGNRVICVKALPKDCTIDSIFSLFSTCGRICGIKMMYKISDMCLVEYTSNEEASSAVELLDGLEIQSQRFLKVEYSNHKNISSKRDDTNYRSYSPSSSLQRFINPRQLHRPSPVLHVTNLPANFSSKELGDLFLHHGFNFDKCVTYGKDKSYSQGRIQMRSVPDAVGALTKLHGRHQRDAKGPLSISFSSTKPILNAYSMPRKD
eukprot:TRINITY_DN359_c0_g2_i2.p1 TRINITY_DN359_c0_g2~~TRINITY_DN359_c0_g2_i2.p1  ORF type:complete len:458 (+),score=48.71 TRINITY_DN359_c0_g2_i2:428-1801(+)